MPTKDPEKRRLANQRYYDNRRRGQQQRRGSGQGNKEFNPITFDPYRGL